VKASSRLILERLLVASLLIIIFASGFSGSNAAVEASKIEREAIAKVDMNYTNTIINGSIGIIDKEIPNSLIIKDSTFRGSIRFINCTFNGSIEFTNCTFLEPITFLNSTFINKFYLCHSNLTKETNFADCTFYQVSDFGNDKFLGPAKFMSCRFLGGILNNTNFESAEFNKCVTFYNSSFDKISLSNAKFLGDVFFSYSKFNKSANFNNAEFHGRDNEFIKAKFLGDVTFQFVNFDNTSQFMDTYFADNSNFLKSTFEYADFSNSFFKKNTKFDNTNFTKAATFINSTFYQGASFKYANFGGESKTNFALSKFFNNTTNFQNAEFKGIADFSNTIFTGKASFYFTKFKDDALLESAQFKNGINLNKTKYDRLYIKWSNINQMDFNETTYQSLIDNFKKMGSMDDANECYYAFRGSSIQNGGGDYLIRLLGEGAMYTYGFGVKPDRPLYWSVGIVLFFALIWFYFGFSKTELFETISSIPGEEVLSTEVDEYCPHCSGRKHLISTENPLIFSIGVFLSGTKFFIDPPAIPESMKLLSPGSAKTVFMIERALGAILSVLFFFALSKTIIGSA
jgi:hypothetical protein